MLFHSFDNLPLSICFHPISDCLKNRWWYFLSRKVGIGGVEVVRHSVIASLINLISWWLTFVLYFCIFVYIVSDAFSHDSVSRGCLQLRKCW
jgi:hypothetical protein